MSLTKADMKAIKEVVTDVVHDVIAKEVSPRFDALQSNLEKKMDRNHAVNLQYHLETHKLISDQAQKSDRFRESLTKAVVSI